MTEVRCFRRLQESPAKERRGIWLMTGEKRGIFFHGDREEAQSPCWTISDLKHEERNFNGDLGTIPIQEIACDDALLELKSWPEAQQQAKKIIARHQVPHA